jgi:hypothetical protein
VSRPPSDAKVRRRRRRFAIHLGPVAAALICLGVVLGRGGGVLHVVGLAATAQGIGLAIALTWLATGRNPAERG